MVSRVKELCSFPDAVEAARIISGLRWVGLFSHERLVPREGNLLDTLCARLEALMAYAPGERDLVMLQHKFVVERSDGTEVRTLQAKKGLPRTELRTANHYVDTRGIWRAQRALCDGPHCRHTVRDRYTDGP